MSAASPLGGRLPNLPKQPVAQERAAFSWASGWASPHDESSATCPAACPIQGQVEAKCAAMGGMGQLGKSPQEGDPDGSSLFASTVLRIAADVERDETALRDRVAALIGTGDGPRAHRLLDMWKSQPAADVLRLDAADQLD